MAIELKIPDVGESVSEVEIQRWLKSEGDHVEADEPLAELETDKATLELPAPAAGRLTKLLKKAGDTASVGEVVGYVETEDKDAPQKDESEDEVDESQEPQASAGQDTEPRPREKEEPPRREAHVMPAAEVEAARRGMDVDKVSGSGPAGRVLKEDVQRRGEQAERLRPQQSRQDDREEEAVRMSPMRRRIAQRLVEAQQTAALLTTFNEVDMSAVVELRNRHRDAFEKKHKVRLGFMSFFVKASIEALKAHPAINAEIRGEEIVYHNFYDIGIAVNTPKGLVVPVLRNAERMSFAQIEQAIADFAQRAQDNKMELSELEGGTFTISNGGVFGSLLSTPIINPPQSGILGMHAIQDRPVARDKQVIIRPMMYVALTYDHRIVDGKGAVQFLVHLKNILEDPARVLLEI